MAPESVWRTPANGLTATRFLLGPGLAACVLAGEAGWAGALFALAVATDLADGRVARRYGQVSPLGGLLDHAADASFVSFGCAALAALGMLPWLLPPLIALAFLQYALDSRLLSARGLHPSPLGRANGIAYFVVVAIPLLRDALGLGWPGPARVRALGWLLVASTLLSMLDRLRLLLRARRGGSE